MKSASFRVGTMGSVPTISEMIGDYLMMSGQTIISKGMADFTWCLHKGLLKRSRFLGEVMAKVTRVCRL